MSVALKYILRMGDQSFQLNPTQNGKFNWKSTTSASDFGLQNSKFNWNPTKNGNWKSSTSDFGL